jgi:hypothetical protein
LFSTTNRPNEAVVDAVGRSSFRPETSFHLSRRLMMALTIARVSISTRRKLTSILLAVTIFALLVGLAALARGRPVAYGVMDAILVGTGVGLL